MFSDMLKYLRKRAGLTQEELARRTGLKRGRIAMYEVGKREPDFETLEILADFFNVNMSTLIGEEQKKPTTGSDGQQANILDLSLLDEDQIQLINDILKVTPQQRSALLSVAESFLAEQ